MSVSAARRCAYRVVRRVFEEGAYADRALHAEAIELDGRDRALATQLAYGTVQRRRTLDHLLGGLVSRPLEQLDPAVLAALRLGAYQLLLLGGVSDYAAVNESVELVKRESPGGAKFVNAVLRRLAREGPASLAALDDLTARHAAVLHSVPDWLAELWWQQLGADEARLLLAEVNRPAENSLRVNTLISSPEAVSAELGAQLEVHPAPAWKRQPGLPSLPESLVLEGPYDVFSSPLWERGEIMPQSRGSAVVARTLAPLPGQRVLDLCAAPGAKTTHLSALMEAQGELVAVEVHQGRAEALAQTCRRMGATNVTVENIDGRQYQPRELFDRVLVDPPCSGLGTLQIRPDLRWQPRRGQLDQLARKQSELLHAGARALKPGGALVYSVCTISRAEGHDLIERFLGQHAGEFSCEHSWQLLPERDHTDGFFLARLRRADRLPATLR